MGINGKAGHGRGNNRKRPFKRRENDSEVWQKGNLNGWESSHQTVTNRPEGDVKTHNRTSENLANRNSGNRKSGDRAAYYERPKWTPPKIKTEPLPISDCAWCGKPIRDISAAIADKDTGAPVHFDCVISRITFGERLEKGETVTYIGGGRFGIVCFDTPAAQNKDAQAKSPGSMQARQEPDRKIAAPPANRDFNIKKIIEWENKDKRAEWRSVICDHYSVT